VTNSAVDDARTPNKNVLEAEGKEGHLVMKTLFSLLLFCIAGTVTQAQTQEDARWIEQARSTPVGQVEAGFPKERFDQWFADLVKPSETLFDVHECHERLPSGRESQQRLLCVTAYTKPLHPGWRVWLRVSLVVGVLTHSAKKGEPWPATPVPCRFISASVGPSNPRLMIPERSLSNLKEVEKEAPGYRGIAL
jgi:hypothetical protein